MVKLTPEEKKQREIAKWEKEKAKATLPGYMAYFLLIICVVYIGDEVVTQLGGQMQSIIASELFAPIVGADFAVARMSALSSLAMIASALAFLYKPLCDKYGRRLFLVLNTLGMGVGSIFVSLATNIPVYLIGTAFTAFFTPHDMQAIYIQECAPAKYRHRQRRRLHRSPRLRGRRRKLVSDQYRPAGQLLHRSVARHRGHL